MRGLEILPNTGASSKIPCQLALSSVNYSGVRTAIDLRVSPESPSSIAEFLYEDAIGSLCSGVANGRGNERNIVGRAKAASSEPLAHRNVFSKLSFGDLEQLFHSRFN